MSKITFDNAQSPFFKSLKEKVDSYFSVNRLHPAGNNRLLFKGLFQVATAIGLYVILVFFTPSVWVSVLLCAAFGINLAVIGFNIMHEGGHASFSKHKWLNTTSAYFLNVLGGNIYFWKLKHNVNHHTFTNIEGMDSDIDVQPFMRLHEQQPHQWFHKFQHVYCFLLYGISYIVWIFYNDFEKYFSGKIVYGSDAKPLDKREKNIFWVTKILYVSVYLVIPIIMVGFLETLVGFLIVTFVCGLTISVVFQLAHVVEDTHFPQVETENTHIEKEWAIHQVSTTANFATNNPVISWFLGGLNFQVEHHLFPRISHIHYPQLSKIVKETCNEFNVKYLEYPSMTRAFVSHLQHIRSLGKI
jgi:linoleoyl-CoA desaturase